MEPYRSANLCTDQSSGSNCCLCLESAGLFSSHPGLRRQSIMFGRTISIDQIWAEKLVSPFEDNVSTIEKLTKTAALKGAKIVSSQEFAMMINEEDEGKLRGREKLEVSK